MASEPDVEEEKIKQEMLTSIRGAFEKKEEGMPKAVFITMPVRYNKSVLVAKVIQILVKEIPDVEITLFKKGQEPTVFKGEKGDGE